MVGSGNFNGLDWLVVGLYFVVILGIAWWSSRDGRNASTSGFFLGGRDASWWGIGASLFASNIGSEHLIGLAGSGAADGIAVAQFEILAGMILLLLGWFFVPFYLRSGVFTMPEFLERRYSSGPRTYLATVSIVSYVLTKISVTIAAGGIVFEVLMGVDFWLGAFIVVAVTGMYTLWGGMRAVLYTDLVQTVFLIAGAIAVTFIGLQAVGGWQALQTAAGAERFDLWQPMDHPDYPWTGILLGAPILGIWYWCTDQVIVQRVLAARGIAEARRGTIFAGFLKQLPLLIFVVPGVIAYVLVQRGELVLNRPDEALPALIDSLLPAGLRGLVAAGMLAALMSSLSSVFNACSTLITVDIFGRIRKEATEQTKVLVGRLSIVALTGLGVLWIPFMDLISGKLFVYIQSVQAYIAPPVAAIFVLGILWQRMNTQGAIAALWVGGTLGLLRLTLEISNIGSAELFGLFIEMNFLHFAAVLFAVSCTAMVVVSLLTQAPDTVHTRSLTLQTKDAAPTDAASRKLRQQDLWWSLGLLALIAWVWWTFKG